MGENFERPAIHGSNHQLLIFVMGFTGPDGARESPQRNRSVWRLSASCGPGLTEPFSVRVGDAVVIALGGPVVFDVEEYQRGGDDVADSAGVEADVA